MKSLFAVAFICAPLFAAAANGPSIYIEPDQGFEVDIVAAIAKKHVPVRIVTSADGADYVLSANGIQLHSQSTGSKVVRCLFAYCVGIQDQSNVAVQLLDTHIHEIVWGYNVTKADMGKKRQSMAEAIAKHLKRYLKHAFVAAPISSDALATFYNGDPRRRYVSWNIIIDGKKAFRLRGGQFITIKLSPGSHTVGIRRHPKQLTIALLGGEHIYIRPIDSLAERRSLQLSRCSPIHRYMGSGGAMTEVPAKHIYIASVLPEKLFPGTACAASH